MKAKLTLAVVFTLILQIQLFAQNVGINNDGSQPNSSAMLDVSSASKGLLIPRLTQAQRIAIVSLTAGQMVFQTHNTVGFYYYTGSGWEQLALMSMISGVKEKIGVVPADPTLTGSVDKAKLLLGEYDPLGQKGYGVG